ncbi:hypothetical protein [Halopiger xanaduensis]|uniref:hypothetical protein n=1 Tax=Halopiger xanaduensis TaxID=387343 RepID=UPI000B154630|nr:hypothetical protein [Halopiger xanaduensis]
MSTEPATQRARTTCGDCGLPYYADENDACPYCDTSSSASAVEQAGSEPQRDRESEATPSERRRTSSGASSQSLLQRLTYALRDAFRK